NGRLHELLGRELGSWCSEMSYFIEPSAVLSYRRMATTLGVRPVLESVLMPDVASAPFQRPLLAPRTGVPHAISSRVVRSHRHIRRAFRQSRRSSRQVRRYTSVWRTWRHHRCARAPRPTRALSFAGAAVFRWRVVSGGASHLKAFA